MFELNMQLLSLDPELGESDEFGVQPFRSVATDLDKADDNNLITYLGLAHSFSMFLLQIYRHFLVAC